VRSYIDSRYHRLGIFGELNRYNNLWVISLVVVDAVNQCFIKIKHNGFGFGWVVKLWQFNNLMGNLAEVRHFQVVVMDVIKC
jgi:hypothetical protein